jgi:hypothetical protein
MAQDNKVKSSPVKWTDIVKGSKNSLCSKEETLIYKIPTTVNGQVRVNVNKIKSDSSHPAFNKDAILVSQRRKMIKRKKEHRVFIIGDNRARGCTMKVKDNLSDKFDLSGYVKPGASIDSLITTAVNETKSLTKKDVLVFWGGSNDISNNNPRNGLKHVLNLVIIVKQILSWCVYPTDSI